MFNARFARSMAARYRKRGLDKTARAMVELLAQDGVQDATVLEIGGGVGEIQLELLRRGAASATNSSSPRPTTPRPPGCSPRPA
jgi:tripartite-type tricarboxylate transporter receptor subunit TctC